MPRMKPKMGKPKMGGKLGPGLAGKKPRYPKKKKVLKNPNTPGEIRRSIKGFITKAVADMRSNKNKKSKVRT